MAEQRQRHTGGMIALIPADPDALTVPDGDPADEMHLTLAYLGDDVTDWDEERRAAARAAVESVAAEPADITGARIFGHALLNPDGGPDGDRDPCAVHLVGDAPGLTELRARMVDALPGLPAQHEPFIPHITAGYGVPVDRLTATGPVEFDRIRLALGDQRMDVPLTPAAEVKFQSADPRARRLATWWARGEGRARWRPGTPGDYNRLRAALRKEIGPDMSQRVLDGLAANIHHMATGEWPGPKAHGGGKKSAPEGKKMNTDDDETFARLDKYADMADSITVEQVYADAVESEQPLDATSDGELAIENPDGGTTVVEDGEGPSPDAPEGEALFDDEGDEEPDLAAELAALFAEATGDGGR